jgi:predicted amidohydrolase
MVVSPTGAVVGELDDNEGVLSVEIDAAALLGWREKFSAWRDMRILR